MEASPPPRRLIADAAAVSLAAAVVVAGVVAVCALLVKAQAVMLAFFGAIVVAETARPIVDRLSRRIPRPLALALTFAGISAAIVFVWAIPVRALAPQVLAFWRNLPGYLMDVVALLAHYLGEGKPPADGALVALRSMGSAVFPLARGLLGAEAGIAGLLSTIVLVLLMAVFWLGASDALRAFVLTLVRPDARDAASALFEELGDKLSRYVSGSLANGAIVALASMVLLSWIGAPYAIVLGLLQGLLVAVPYLGTLVAALMIGGVVLAAQGWLRAAEAIALISVMEFLEGSFISPLIFKKQLDVEPLSTVLATAIGGTLFGINGVILAVPAAAILKSLTVRVLVPAVRSFSNK
jgi:predicted PurR-regulated permease PerM